MTLQARSHSDAPTVPQDAPKGEYLAAVRRPEHWHAAAQAVCRREGLEPLGDLRHLSVDSSFAVVGVPPEHVIKFYGHWKSGRERYETEVATLGLLGRDPTLPVPRLVAHGQLGDAWRYVVMTALTGVRLADVQAELSPAALRGVASWIGDAAQRFHAIPLTSEEKREGSTRFRTAVRGRLAGLGERPALARALPRHLHEQVVGWMPREDDLLGPRPEAVLVHGALRPHHVLGRLDDGSFLPSGVIDLNSAHIGDPLYDLGYTWWCAFRGDRALLQAYLDETGNAAAAEPDFPRRALAWALLNVCGHAPRLVHLEDARTLDELADRAFGPSAAQVRT